MVQVLVTYVEDQKQSDAGRFKKIIKWDMLKTLKSNRKGLLKTSWMIGYITIFWMKMINNFEQKYVGKPQETPWSTSSSIAIPKTDKKNWGH